MENEELNTQPEVNEVQNTEQTETIDKSTIDDVNVQMDFDYTPFLEEIGKKAKVNHEAYKPTNFDEVVTNIQKGANYDHVKAELEELRKYEKGIQFLKELAEEGETDVDGFVDYQKEQRELAKIQEMAQNRGIDNDEFIKEFYDLKKKADKWDEKSKEDETKSQKEAREKQEYTELLDYFKETNGREADIEKDIPSEVFLIAEKQNVSPKSAFAMYELKKFKEQQAIQQKNEENAETSTGSVSSNGSVKEVAFTEDYIKGMSTKDMAKYWDNPAFRKAVGLK